MILRQYQSLGLLPELIVLSFLIMNFLTVAYVLFKINYRAPVIMVPNAVGTGALKPAYPDDEYVRAFTGNFLANWTTWNQYTYQYRRTVAISMMTPSVRDEITNQSAQSNGLLASMAESRSFLCRDLSIKEVDPARRFIQVDFSGDMRVYYGGVGGKAEPYGGHLMLHLVTPEPNSPLCLEVYGFLVDRPKEAKP